MSLLAIRNGALIDGTGRDRIPNAAVLLNGSKIVAAGPEHEVLAGIPEEYTEIDAQGGTILPGFIDSHVHIMMQGFDLEKDLMTPLLQVLPGHHLLPPHHRGRHHQRARRRRYGPRRPARHR